MTTSHRINVVATPLWGVRIFGVAPSGRRTAPKVFARRPPWLQRVRTHKMTCSKFVSVLTAMAVTGTAATLFAQGGTKPANVGEGTLMVKGKNYPLKNAVAYETTVDGEEGIAVVLSGPTISSEKLNAARKSEKAGEIPDFRKPYVKLEFTKARLCAKVQCWRRARLLRARLRFMIWRGKKFTSGRQTHPLKYQPGQL